MFLEVDSQIKRLKENKHKFPFKKMNKINNYTDIKIACNFYSNIRLYSYELELVFI